MTSVHFTKVKVMSYFDLKMLMYYKVGGVISFITWVVLVRKECGCVGRGGGHSEKLITSFVDRRIHSKITVVT